MSIINHGSTGANMWQLSNQSLQQEAKEIRERAAGDGGKELRKTAETIKDIFQTVDKLSKAHLNSLEYFKWLRRIHHTFQQWGCASILHPDFEQLQINSDKALKETENNKSSIQKEKNKQEKEDDFNTEESYLTPSRSLADTFAQSESKITRTTRTIQQISMVLAQAMSTTIHTDLQHLVRDSSFTGKRITPALIWENVIRWGLPNPGRLEVTLKGNLEDKIRDAFLHSNLEDALIIINDNLEFLKMLSGGQEFNFPALFSYVKKAIVCKSSFIQTAFVSHHIQHTFQTWQEIHDKLRAWAIEDDRESISTPTALVTTTKQEDTPKFKYPCGYCGSDKHTHKKCDARSKDMREGKNIPGRPGSFFAKMHERRSEKKESKALLVGSPSGGAPSPATSEQSPPHNRVYNFKSTEDMTATMVAVKEGILRFTAAQQESESALMVYEQQQAKEQISNSTVEAVLDTGATVHLFHSPTATSLYNRRHVSGLPRISTAKMGVSMAMNEVATLSATWEDQDITLEGHFVPDITNTLVSAAALMDEGLRLRLNEDGQTIEFYKPEDQNTTRIAFRRKGNLFVATLHLKKPTTALAAQAHSPDSSAQIIHNSLGHVGITEMREQLEAKAHVLAERSKMLQELEEAIQAVNNKAAKSKVEKELQEITKLIQEADKVNSTESIVKQAIKDNEQKQPKLRRHKIK